MMCDLCVCVNVHMRADSAVMQICAFVLLFNKNKKKKRGKKQWFYHCRFRNWPRCGAERLVVCWCRGEE